MADVDANVEICIVCHHCDQSTSLTRPDINIRASSIPDTLGCTGLAPSQVAVVNETMSATLADIFELDLDILRRQVATKELERKRKALQCFIDNHNSLLNPITRLPAEVLSQIFQHCIVVNWLEKGLHTCQPLDKTPLMIASVSRHWRNVALGTARLWSALSLTLRPKHVKKHIELASMWLSRSGQSPLSIHLTTHSDIRDSMRKLMNIFASKSAKWRHIYFKLPLPMFQSLSSGKSRLPILEMLKLELWEPNHSSALNLFTQAPRLRDFTAGQYVTEGSLTLPWSQLRNINIIPLLFETQHVHGFLSLAQDVEHAYFRVGKYHTSRYPATLELRNLRSLTAVFHQLDPIPFFAILNAPRICNLSLSVVTEAPMGPLWTSLCSQTSLETLRIHVGHSGDFDGQVIIQILQGLKHLRVLEVYIMKDVFFSADFLESFAQRSPSGTPLLGPNLKTLAFRRFPLDLNFDSFARALQSRYLSSSQAVLETVTIFSDKDTIASTLASYQTSAWWDQLRDVGINLRLQDHNTYAWWCRSS